MSASLETTGVVIILAWSSGVVAVQFKGHDLCFRLSTLNTTSSTNEMMEWDYKQPRYMCSSPNTYLSPYQSPPLLLHLDSGHVEKSMFAAI